MRNYLKILIVVFLFVIRVFADPADTTNTKNPADTTKYKKTVISYKGIIEKSGYFYEYYGMIDGLEDNLYHSTILYSKHERKMTDYEDTIKLKSEEILLFEVFLTGGLYIGKSDFEKITGLKYSNMFEPNPFDIGKERKLSIVKSGYNTFVKYLVKDVPVLLFEMPFSELEKYRDRIGYNTIINKNSEMITIGVILSKESEISRSLLKKK
jgi:hypothetical protein